MSASKSIKFEISLKELKVTFEGDIQSAERMQGEITGAINSLAAAQSKMLAAGPKTPPVMPADSISGVRGRRRNRRRQGSSIDATFIEGTAVPDSDGGLPNDTRPVARRSVGGGQQIPLITQLKDEGFFAAQRTNGDVRAELAKKGHTYKSNELNFPLVQLTKEGVLKREKDTDRHQWVYFAG